MNRTEAAEVFAESFRKYRTPLTPHDQLRLTPAPENLGELEVAARALELSSAEVGTPASEREKMLLYEARLLVAMNLQHAAIHLYEGFLREFPGSPSRSIVAERLAKLRQEEEGGAGR